MPSCPACGQHRSASEGPCPTCGFTDVPADHDRLAPPSWLAADAPGDPVASAVVGGSVRPPPLAAGDPGDTSDPLSGWDTDSSPVTVGPPGDPVEDWVLVAGAGMVGMIAGAVLTRRVGRALVVGLVAAAGAGARRRVWETAPPDDSWARSFAD